MAERRSGKPYIWVTWLSKLLGGDQCVWAAWFKAHHRYERYEPRASQLARWARDHDELMAARRAALEADGWLVRAERETEWKLKGKAALVAGRCDVVATRDREALVVDGKTGTARQSDWWQVLLYLYALPLARQDLHDMSLAGELHYASSDDVAVTPTELTRERKERIVGLIRQVAGDEPPPRAPSASECAWCNIGPGDCPERVMEPVVASTTDF